MTRRRLAIGLLLIAGATALVTSWPPRTLVPLLYPREQTFLETATERIFTLDVVNVMPMLAPQVLRQGGGERVGVVHLLRSLLYPMRAYSPPRLIGASPLATSGTLNGHPVRTFDVLLENGAYLEVSLEYLPSGALRIVRFGPWEFTERWPASEPRSGAWLAGRNSRPASPETTPVLSSPR